MAKYSIEDSTLVGIADAIRAKTGKTDKLAPAAMAAEIGSISTGGGGNYGTCAVTINASNIPNYWLVQYMRLNDAGEPENWALECARSTTTATINAVKGSNIYIWSSGVKLSHGIKPTEAGRVMGIAGNESPVPDRGYAFVLYETAPDTATITVEWD